MVKHEEVRITIILSNYTSIIFNELTEKFGELHKYEIPYNDTVAVAVVDRELEDSKIKQYFDEIMNYYNATGEELLKQEYKIRKKEVKEKWLNGNFNYWLLENN